MLKESDRAVLTADELNLVNGGGARANEHGDACLSPSCLGCLPENKADVFEKLATKLAAERKLRKQVEANFDELVNEGATPEDRASGFLECLRQQTASADRLAGQVNSLETKLDNAYAGMDLLRKDAAELVQIRLVFRELRNFIIELGHIKTSPELEDDEADQQGKLLIKNKVDLCVRALALIIPEVQPGELAAFKTGFLTALECE